MPGGPHSTSLVLMTLASFFLVVDISSKYLHQEGKLNFGDFLKSGFSVICFVAIISRIFTEGLVHNF
jgi:hypothetical protein